MDISELLVDLLEIGGKSVLGKVTQEMYDQLKGLVKKKFSGKPDAELVLAEHAKNPEIWKEPLRAKLIEADVSQDTDIMNLAQQLLVELKSQQVAVGKYNVQAETIQGFIQGDHAKVRMDFGTK